jgi:hypothetical protein
VKLRWLAVLIIALSCSGQGIEAQSCDVLQNLLGNWEWRTDHPGANSPRGSFSFTRDPGTKVIIARGSRTYPSGKPSREFFVIPHNFTEAKNQSTYFDNRGHVSQCAVASSAMKCTLSLTCRSQGVHFQYVFLVPTNGVPKFQLQVPPPHHHAEFVPFIQGVLTKRNSSIVDEQ